VTWLYYSLSLVLWLDTFCTAFICVLEMKPVFVLVLLRCMTGCFFFAEDNFDYDDAECFIHCIKIPACCIIRAKAERLM